MTEAYVGKKHGLVRFTVNGQPRDIDCWLLREREKHTRVLMIGKPRGPAYEQVVENARVLTRVVPIDDAEDRQLVPDGKTYSRFGIIAGEKVYVVAVGTKNTRICPIEGTNRYSFKVPSEDVQVLSAPKKSNSSEVPPSWFEGFDDAPTVAALNSEVSDEVEVPEVEDEEVYEDELDEVKDEDDDT